MRSHLPPSSEPTTGAPRSRSYVSSWQQFITYFGGFDASNGYLLPFAVNQYFVNGGPGCWVVRAAPSNAVAASFTVNDRASTPAALLKLTAKSKGAWGANLYVDVRDSGVSGAGRVDVIIRMGGTADAYIVERWLDASLNPSDARYLVNLINSPYAGSNYVTATNMHNTAAGYQWMVTETPAVTAAAQFAGGSDGTGTADLVAAAKTFDGYHDNIVLNLPGVVAADITNTLNPLIAWAASKGNVFLVLDGYQTLAGETSSAFVTRQVAAVSGASPLTATSYAALYSPWLLVDDPASAVPGSVRSLPPGGAVIAKYMTTDAARGVQKPPAGLGTSLSGVLGTEFNFTSTDLDTLNAAGVNVVRNVPGAGYCVMGARTLKSGFPDRYVSVRRTLMYLRKALVEQTRFAIFEPNTPDLWDTISAVVTQFLTGIMQLGMLAGSTTEDSFFVQCDEDNNPPAAVGAGEVHITVGVALSSPAEFIIIKIGQYAGSSTTTETTA